MGLAEYRIGKAPERLMTMALGSCLGIILYDGKIRLGAMAHVMHPRRDSVKNNRNMAKFVDTAIALMLGKMVREGANLKGTVAKLFGGAEMFGDVKGCRGVIQIGSANVKAARAELNALRIPIVSECVGGNRGRTIVLDTTDGSVLVQDAYCNEEIY